MFPNKSTTPSKDKEGMREGVSGRERGEWIGGEKVSRLTDYIPIL